MATWNNDPLITTLRAGTAEDPFSNLSENFIIPSVCKILLSELPDPIQKLTINGFYETTNTSPAVDNFYCNYYTRQVNFNVANIGDNISISYFGRGNISIPISQVYTLLDEYGDIEQTLEEMIDNYNLHTEDERIANEAIRVSSENTRINQESARVIADGLRTTAEDARVIAENARVTGGALIKSGDTMTGDLNMEENGIIFGNIKVAKNLSLGTLDVTII